jgi:hypothetical protein
MDKLLQWAILNSATANEDAPATSSDHLRELGPIDDELLEAILGKDEAKLMQECMQVICSKDATHDQKNIAFEDLEMMVGQVDNARNLEPLHMWPILMELLDSTEQDWRMHTAWVCGTAVQNNPPAKEAARYFIESDGV